MKSFTTRSFLRLVVGASALAIATAPGIAAAQDTPTTEPAADDGDEIIVTGIRASLRQSLDIKRDSNGVVDAISAEDIGKFPDTNLAESLQR
ncbi:MAG: hypothetical protein V4574_18225, partial [Pseudomonadota bacterium]